MRPADRPPSWNHTNADHSIVAFVQFVTQPGGTDFASPAERIALLDDDVTLRPSSQRISNSHSPLTATRLRHCGITSGMPLTD